MRRSDSPAVRRDYDMKPLPLNGNPSKLKLLMKRLRKSSPSRIPPYADAYSTAQSFPSKTRTNLLEPPQSNSKQSEKFSLVKADSDIRLLEKNRALEATDVPMGNVVNSMPGFNYGVSVSWLAKKKQGTRKGSTILKGPNSFSKPSSVKDTANEVRSKLLLSAKQGANFNSLTESLDAVSLKEEEINNFMDVPPSAFNSESCWSFEDDWSESNSIILVEADWGDENVSVYSSTSFQNMKIDWLPSFAQKESCEWQPCHRQATHKVNILGKEYGLCGEVCAQKFKMRLMQITSWEKWLPRFKEVLAEKHLVKLLYIYHKDGYTPLYFAIMYNYPLLVREILQSMDKPVPDILNPFGLMMACVEGYCEVVEILLKGRFPIYCADGIFPTFAHTDNIDLLQGVRQGKAEESSKVKIQALLAKFISVRKQELATAFCCVLVEHWNGRVFKSIVDLLVEYSIT